MLTQVEKLVNEEFENLKKFFKITPEKPKYKLLDKHQFDKAQAKSHSQALAFLYGKPKAMWMLSGATTKSRELRKDLASLRQSVIGYYDYPTETLYLSSEDLDRHTIRHEIVHYFQHKLYDVPKSDVAKIVAESHADFVSYLLDPESELRKALDAIAAGETTLSMKLDSRSNASAQEATESPYVKGFPLLFTIYGKLGQDALNSLWSETLFPTKEDISNPSNWVEKAAANA